jgi:DNA repair exonuclease SbcCD nuclease subunit
VTAVPVYAVSQIGAQVTPQGDQDILLTHGEFRGKLQGMRQGATRLPPALGAWAYVALGHYHVCTEVAPRVWYSGSLEYGSTNPWGDRAEEAKVGRPGKGWLLVELGAGEPVVTFQPIDPPRRILDLPSLDATDMGAATLDVELACRLTSVDITGAWVRLVVTNVSRRVQRELDHKALRRFLGEALNLHLDFRRPIAEAPTVANRARTRQTLDTIVRDFLGARALPDDVDRARLQALGEQYVVAASSAEDPYTGEKVA